jgi:hypothetical protein
LAAEVEKGVYKADLVSIPGIATVQRLEVVEEKNLPSSLPYKELGRC